MLLEGVAENERVEIRQMSRDKDQCPARGESPKLIDVALGLNQGIQAASWFAPIGGEGGWIHDSGQKTRDEVLRQAVHPRVEVPGHVRDHATDDALESSPHVRVVHAADSSEYAVPVSKSVVCFLVLLACETV